MRYRRFHKARFQTSTPMIDPLPIAAVNNQQRQDIEMVDRIRIPRINRAIDGSSRLGSYELDFSMEVEEGVGGGFCIKKRSIRG